LTPELDVPQGFERVLERLPPGSRILDFGCGRGHTVAWLAENGWDAWGVDIDQSELAHAPTDRVSLVEDGRIPFDDGAFAFVFTNQVFEHVADLDEVASEIARVTAPRGLGLHEWPSRWRPVEPHYNMLLVHWLPKNRLRRLVIRGWLAAGVYPRAMPRGLDHREVADRTYAYANEQTFYRSHRAIRAVLERHGFDGSWVKHTRCPAIAAPLFRCVRVATLLSTKR
jgi:SAM-dependent methyltransferase